MKIISKSGSHHLFLVDDFENSWNVLHYAIYYFNYRMVKILLNLKIQELPKLLNHKDKNGMTPFDLLRSNLFSCATSNNSVYSIRQDGSFKAKYIEDNQPTAIKHSSSIIISTNSGEFLNFDLDDELLFPPPLTNTLLSFKIMKLVTSLSHSALITGDGRLYMTSFSANLLNSSFCRIKFFDDLWASGEIVTDISLTSSHAIVLTNLNKLYTFGTNIKRLNLYPSSDTAYPNTSVTLHSSNSSSSVISNSSSRASTSNLILNNGSNEYTKDYSSLIPLQVLTKSASLSKSSTPNSTGASSSVGNNFSLLTSLRALEPPNTDDSSSRLSGVTSSNNHTIVYSKDSLHIYGLNLGQFGPVTNSKSFTRENSGNSQVAQMASSAHVVWRYGNDPIFKVLAFDLATLVVTKSSAIHIYCSGLHVQMSLPSNQDIDKTWNSFKPRVLSTPKQIKKMVSPITGEKSDTINPNLSGSLNSTYSVLLLLDNGEVTMLTFPKYAESKDSFKEAVKFSTIWRPARLELKASDISIGEFKPNCNGAVLCTINGEVFKKGKTKWSRINGLTNISLVSIGFGFLPRGTFTNDLSPKIMMLREENAQLKHSVTIPKTKNEFAIFSPLSKFWRNSDYIDTQYEDIDFWGNEMIKSKKAVDGFDDELTEDDEYNRENGLLFSKHLNSKFTNQFSDFYQIMQSEEIFCINMILDEKDEPSGLKNEKFFDYPIHVKNTKSGFETTFTVHKRFFFNRLGIQSEQFSLDRKNLTFQFGENEGSIVGDLDIRSVAIFIHILYSDQETHTLTPMINFDQSICSGIERLSYTFSKVPFDEAMSRTFGDETCGDITVRLANDQQVKAWKYLLISRSEYFKQLFSNAWLDAKDVDFRHVEKSTWKLLMNYFQGLANDEIFYETIKGLIESNIKKINLNSVLLKRKPKAVLTENQDSYIENDDFVNLVLDLMYLSNELLLPDLKNLCELAIKDCITLDNYDVLLLHSYYSKSEQLFSNCSWFIFRNLLSSYNDPKTNYTALGDECCELLEQRLHELIEIYYTGGRQGLLGSRGIKNFKDDIESFNGHFLHEYLWDVYGVTDDDIFKHDALQRNKSGTVKQVRSSSVSSNIGDSRRHETDSPVQPRLDLGSAIDTKDENDAGSGFIVVEKGRRKSSTSKPKTSSPVPTRRSSKGGFRLSEDVKTFLSKENETAIGEDKPVIKEWTFRISNEGSSGDVLVGSSHDIDEILQQRTHKRTTLKSTKMTIPKLSQKERKQKEREEAEKQRLALENDRSKAKGTAVNSSPWNINNAWGVSTSKVVGTPVDDSLGPKSISKFTELNTAAVITPNKLTAVHFPTLEELRHAKKTTEFIPSAVLEELDEPVVPIKTLDEIRQEEEFARWWEEESRRVQREMGILVENKDTNRGSRGSRGNRGSKAHRGSRGNRGSKGSRGNRGSKESSGSANSGRDRGGDNSGRGNESGEGKGDKKKGRGEKSVTIK